MTQEEKSLLLKDLCARLPYNVVCQFKDDIRLIDGIKRPYYDYVLSERHIELFRNHKGFYIKPYLRPMSSMTEEENEEYIKMNLYGTHWGFVDWCNSRHLDFRGLIPKGLAIEVSEENNPYKE